MTYSLQLGRQENHRGSCPCLAKTSPRPTIPSLNFIQSAINELARDKALTDTRERQDKPATCLKDLPRKHGEMKVSLLA
ncbi:hypothetical protein RRG08_043026 [Elysia crispata]|uniref:Uncharacterized protein n=1 Tax=Elysia crispata TaxID=231223 RepID=A0AAE0XYS4_9GAST|nr:hypothetical protein RRG08_043026 [Elysia crispata]